MTSPTPPAADPRPTRLRIAIVGAGPAGLATALACARRLACEITVFERAAELKPVGAGLLLQPIGLAVLEALGLRDDALAAGSRIDRLYGTNHAGVPVIDLAYERLAPGAHGIGIARRRLHQLLVRAFRRSGARLELGCAIEHIERTHDAVDLGAGERRYGPYDLVVLADGTRSALRRAAGLAAEVRPYPWGAVWATVPCAGGGRTLRQHFRSAREMLGLLPSGEAVDGEPALLTFFWSLPQDAYDAWRATPIERWKARVAALSADAAAPLAEIAHLDALDRAWYADVRMPKPFHARVVALGDCAHATSPQLGQGVNLALLDAYALAESLAAHGPARVDAALAGYAAKRRSHVRYYQWASRILTPLFQSHRRLLPALRDRCARYAARLPFVGRHALHTLAGTKTGILSTARDSASLLRQHELHR